MIYFVTAIGTDSGKTIVSAILTEFLKADYWKPVQSGYPRDSETVQALLTNEESTVHEERFLLKTPASPHASARIDGIEINLSAFEPPETKADLIVEGAGGVLVPLNDEDNVIDIAERLKAEIIVVSNLYLGNINHTLLTLDYLERRRLPVKGLIFNGPSNPESERIILKRSGLQCLLQIEKEDKFDQKTVRKYGEQLRRSWNR